MKILIKLTLYPLLFCWSCTDQAPKMSDNQLVWQNIPGRDTGISRIRPFIYRVKAPASWHRQFPSDTDSIFDTTKPLCEFLIKENTSMIRITIHNFPTDEIEERIAPASQIARWKRQFEQLDEISLNVKPIAHGGFAGLFFEAIGTLENRKTKVLGWSLQLSAEHYRNLASIDLSTQNEFKQLRSDYTIKVVGPVELVEKHQAILMLFANSFELIEEIPGRL